MHAPGHDEWGIFKLIIATLVCDQKGNNYLVYQLWGRLQDEEFTLYPTKYKPIQGWLSTKYLDNIRNGQMTQANCRWKTGAV